MAVRPLVLVYQELETITVSVDLADLNCLIVAPCYARWPYATRKSSIQAADYGDLACEAFGLNPAGPSLGDTAFAGDLPQRATTDRGAPESVHVYLDDGYAELCHGTDGLVDDTVFTGFSSVDPKRLEGAAPNEATDFVVADAAAGDKLVLFPALKEKDGGVGPEAVTDGTITAAAPANTTGLQVDSFPAANSVKLKTFGAPPAYPLGTKVRAGGCTHAVNDGVAFVAALDATTVTLVREADYETVGEISTAITVSVIRDRLASVSNPFTAFTTGEAYVEVFDMGVGYDGVYPVRLKVGAGAVILEGAEFPADAVSVPFRVYNSGAVSVEAATKRVARLSKAALETLSGVYEYAAGKPKYTPATTPSAANVGRYLVSGLISARILAVDGTDYLLEMGGEYPAPSAVTTAYVCDTPVRLNTTAFDAFDTSLVGAYLFLQEEFTDTALGNLVASVDNELGLILTDPVGDDDIAGEVLRQNIQRTIVGSIAANALTLDKILDSTVYYLGASYPMPYHLLRRLDDFELASTQWAYDTPLANWVTIMGGRTVLVENFARQLVYALVYIEHNDLRKDTTILSVQTVSSQAEVLAKAGDIHAENPLALLAEVARQNTSTSIQILGVDGDNLEDVHDALAAYTKAKDTISSRKDIYAIVPGSIETSVLAMWKAHVEAVADPEKSRFRMVIGAWQLPSYRTISDIPLVGGVMKPGGTIQETTAPVYVNTFKDNTDDLGEATVPPGRYVPYGTGTRDNPQVFVHATTDNPVGGETGTVEHAILDGVAHTGDLVLVTEAADTNDRGLYVIHGITGAVASLVRINGTKLTWGTPQALGCDFALFQWDDRAIGNEGSVLNSANSVLLGSTAALAFFDLVPDVGGDDDLKWFVRGDIFPGAPGAEAGLYRVAAGSVADYTTAAEAAIAPGVADAVCSMAVNVITVLGQGGLAGSILPRMVAKLLLVPPPAPPDPDDGYYEILSAVDNAGALDITVNAKIGPVSAIDWGFLAFAGGASRVTVMYGIAQAIPEASRDLTYAEFEKFNETASTWAAAVFTSGVPAFDWGAFYEGVLHELQGDCGSVKGALDNQYENNVDAQGSPLPGDRLYVVHDGSGVAPSMKGTNYVIYKVNAAHDFEVVGASPFPKAGVDLANLSYYIMRDTDGDGLPDTYILGTASAPVYAQKVTLAVPDARYVELRDAYASFLTDGVSAGDLLEIPVPIDREGVDVLFDPWYDDDDYVTLVVAQVINENRLLVDTTAALGELPSKSSGSSQVGRTNLRFRVRRALTKEQQIDYLEAYTAGFDSKRLVLVWPDTVELGSLAAGTHSAIYLAAVVGGMVAGLSPQQGFTRLGIAGVDRLRNAGDYFTDDEITEISNAGWCVFLQDTEESLPYCVHQLTTHQGGIADYEEISVVKNFDFVSTSYKTALEDIYGKYNLVADTIDLVSNTLNGVTSALRARSLPFYGAPIIDASITSIARLAGTQDRAEAYMTVTYPSPLNRIGLHLSGSAG